MSEEAGARSADAARDVAEALADLEANRPPERIVGRLRAIEPHVPAASRAEFLRARALATNRLGFPGEALGDLHEARDLLEAVGDASGLARVLRAIALVHVWRGDAGEAALALLGAIAQAERVGDHADVALSLVEAGRLQVEIGRPRAAVAMFDQALGRDVGLAPRELRRAGVNLAQALNAAGRPAEALARLPSIAAALPEPGGRLSFLLALVEASAASATGDRARAEGALARAGTLAGEDPESFERVELAHARADIALAAGEPVAAHRLLTDVCARYAADDLAGREIAARLSDAEALDALGRPEEADRTLAAALRRAVARELSGYADRVRSRIGARGRGTTAARGGEETADVAQRFVRRRPLGAGGFASVTRAYDIENGVEVALKRISLADSWDGAARARLVESARTEIAAAALVVHPGVARIHDLLTGAEGDIWLAQEFIEGPTLRKAMEAGPPTARALELLARVAFALGAVHDAGIVHGDVKPENVVLRGERQPVLVDFGIARIGAGGQAKGGTRAYVAPEQARGAAIDGRADLYAFGVMACEVLTGERPAPCDPRVIGVLTRWRDPRRATARLLTAGVPARAAAIIGQAIAPWRAMRPARAADIALALAGAARA